MPCTTILVGKKASYDGSTMIARNDDSPSGQFTPKKFVVVHPEEQPKKYKSVLSHVEIDLPEDPMRYTAVPNALDGEGIWAAHGVNAAGVGMTATETITSNARVLGADPLVEYVPEKDGVEEISGGIGEEDIVSLVLPYIHSAREGVTRLGSLLEKYGTYEMNGIAFSAEKIPASRSPRKNTSEKAKHPTKSPMPIPVNMVFFARFCSPAPTFCDTKEEVDCISALGISMAKLTILHATP